MNTNTITLDDSWYREKNQAFRAALERNDPKTAIEIAVMIGCFHPDPAADREMASPGRAEMFESLAAFWIGVGQEATGQPFAERALAIRRHLADQQLRAVGLDGLVVDKELTTMIENPIDVPGPAFEREGFLVEVSRQVVAGVWQSQGLPRQQVAMTIELNQPWHLILCHRGLGFNFVNLEFTEARRHGVTGEFLFCSVATFEGEWGQSNRETILSRHVLRVPVKSAEPGKEEKIRVGWIMAQLPQRPTA
jgi:hypothetical protein